MDISVDQTANKAVFNITGEIDEQGAEKLKSGFQALDKNKVTEVVMNFAGVTHIGSAGIGKLLMFYRDIGVRGGSLSIINVPGTIHALLLSLKLDSVFTIQK